MTDLYANPESQLREIMEQNPHLAEYDGDTVAEKVDNAMCQMRTVKWAAMTDREIELTTALAMLAGSIKGVAQALEWPGANLTTLPTNLHAYADEALAVLNKKEKA